MLTAHLRAIPASIHPVGQAEAANYTERARLARALSSEAPNEVLVSVHQSLACRYAALAAELGRHDRVRGPIS